MQSLSAPQFLVSPVMALMTNTEGFAAHVSVQNAGGSGPALLEGRLFGRGSRLLFVPEVPTRVFSKRKAAEQTSYSWNAALGEGFIFNEALQGYAPFSRPGRPTAVELGDIGAVYEKIGGQRCRKRQAVISTSDGAKIEAAVWLSSELKGFPMQIKASNGQLVCVFTEVSLAPVALAAFLPPDGFTAYASPDAMLSALLERQNAMRKDIWEDTLAPDEADPGAPTGNNRAR